MMALRTKGTDNLVQWGYCLRSRGYMFLIHGTSGRVEFLFVELTASEWYQLIANIKADFKRLGPSISNIRQRLKRWSLFINPFRRVQRTVLALAQRLAAIKLEEPAPRPLALTRAAADEHHKKMERWGYDTFLAATLGTSIRMLAPVLAEAFVNFVSFVLARSDVRADDRVYEHLLRQPIDVRVRSLHIYCEGFTKPVNYDDPAFAKFHTVMNSRNDFLHGNVDPKRLSFEEVFIDTFHGDQIIPLFKDDRGMIARYVRNSLKFVEPEGALNDLDVVRSFVVYLLGEMDAPARERIERLMDRDYLAWHPSTGEVAELLADATVESILIIDEE